MLPYDYMTKWLKESKKHLTEESEFEFENYGRYNINEYDALIYNRRLLDIAKFIRNNQGCKMLDVGCGVGNDALYFNYCGANVTGIDIKKERLDCAKERFLIKNKFLEGHGKVKCNFIEKNLLELDDNQYDAIWMKETFHHLEPRVDIVKKLSQLTKTGGHLFISETNAYNPLIQGVLLKKRGFKTIKTFTDSNGNEMMYGDERIIGLRGLKNILEDNGYCVDEVSYFRVFPRKIAYAIGVHRASYIEKRLLLEKIPFLAVHYNVVARKR